MIGIEIAGLRVALDAADAELASLLRARYAAFLAPPASPLLTLRVAVNAGRDYVPPGDGAWVIETETVGERRTYRSYSDAGWFDLRSGHGVVDLREPMDCENFLRVLYAELCARHEGLLLHASAVLRGERAYVFFGPSGSGKSTTAHLSLDAGMTVLGDDIVIVRRTAGLFRGYAVPFRGSNSRVPQLGASAALAGVFALAHSERHAQAPLSRAEAVARLAASVPFVMSEPISGARVMATCEQLVRAVPVAELRFRRDAQFWRIIGESTSAIPDPA